MDSYYYSYYLRDKFTISYISFYQNHKLINSGINCIYVKGSSNFHKYFNLFKTIVLFLKNSEISIIYFIYFKGVSLYRILAYGRNTILDIRSGYISYNPVKNYFFNFLLLLEAQLFRDRIIISESLARHIGIKNVVIIGLGGINLNIKKREHSSFNFTYVGVLNNRGIDILIRAFCKYARNSSNDIKLHIVGDIFTKTGYELIRLKNYLSCDRILFYGYLANKDLKRVLEITDFSISYVPITPFYNYQPVTKTYEALVNGIPVLATSTYENCRIIGKKNGILILDCENEIERGLDLAYNKLHRNEIEIIEQSYREYEWENIVKNRLVPFINNLK